MAQLYHPGAWTVGGYRLPDFSITERLSDAFGGTRNDQGGSQFSSWATAPAQLTANQGLASQQLWASTQTPTFNSGQVLRAYDNAAGGGGGGNPAPIPNPTPNPTPNPSMDTGAFDNAWSGYLQSLDQQLGGLEQQKSSQLATAQGTRDTGLANLQSQYTTNEGQIKDQQTKTLNDLTTALQGYWQQGNAMLGTRGASDSSASPMYSYALAKLGSKQRGDVMADYSSRLQNLKSVYDQNKNNLENDYNTQVNQIGQWFAEAQNAIRGMQGQAAQQKGQQILDYGMQLLGQQQQQYQQQKSLLDQWVANKSTTLQQLMAGMNQNAQNMPGYQNIFGNLQGGTSQSTQMPGYGNMFAQEESKPLFQV